MKDPELPTRTSDTDPVRIDAVELRHSRLGLTFCPGKRQRGARTGDWARSLAADLDAIRDWGATAVVTAMERFELGTLGVAELGEAVEARGIDWHLVEIADGGIPDDRAVVRWRYVEADLQRRLARGESVVIHCKGGLGRTGMLAALVVARELRIGADEAITLVRQARPGAIENPAQERFVRETAGARAVPESMLACLIGGAVGDGFGYAVEFDDLAAIRAKHGAAGLVEPVYRCGLLEVSDDTQMTLFTAEGMCLAGAEAGVEAMTDAVHAAYLRWLSTQGRGGAAAETDAAGWLLGVAALHKAQAPGNTCLAALGSGVCGTIASPINHSKGCGGVMRVAPVALWRRYSRDQAFELAARLAAITHGHPSGYWSAAALAWILREAIDGVSLAATVDGVIARLGPCDGGHETTTALAKAATLGAGSGELDGCIRQLGQGWVGEEALAIAVFAVLRAETFADAVRIATNHDGDSDSTASIAGQIWGAMHGLGGIPHAWARRLDVFDALLETAVRLATAEERGR